MTPQHALPVVPRAVRRWLLALALLVVLVPIMPLRVRGERLLVVSASRGTDIPSCGTPSSPCKTITYALTNRAADGDAISIEAGGYAESLDVNKSVTFTGVAGAAQTRIVGVGTTRVFLVRGGTNVTISGVTIADGKSTADGAGIHNDGILTLKESVVIGNALGKFGHEECGPCAGGGIYNRGRLQLANVIVSNNSANGGYVNGVFLPGQPLVDPKDVGGGIYNEGSLSVYSSTISGNTASFGGGGISNGGTAELTNTTLSGNDGGLLSYGGTVTLINSTVAFNKIGIFTYNGSLVTVKNSIIANSTVGTNCDGTITSEGYNLDNGSTCHFNGSHDVQNNDPKLSPLAYNGGSTLTHALQLGSFAIDGGGTSANGCASQDQRGVTRPQGAACDIGAFEYTPADQAALTAPPPSSSVAPSSGNTASGTTNPVVSPPVASPPAASPSGATAPSGAAGPVTSAGGSPVSGGSFAAPSFQSQWQQGESLATNFWGPLATARSRQESYAEAPGGQRLVEYFDKGRMELTDPGSGVVTNGLLATELITGQLQMGNGTFQPRAAAAIPIAGDADNVGPTYTALGTTAAVLLNATPVQMGNTVTTNVATNGTVTPGTATAGVGPTALTVYDTVTQHNVPQAFATYRDHVGLLTIGYAKSEPFLTMVKVAGQQKQVMVQVFERRVLTYTADNPDAFMVEMGNIGQHYDRWRYGTP